MTFILKTRTAACIAALLAGAAFAAGPVLAQDAPAEAQAPAAADAAPAADAAADAAPAADAVVARIGDEAVTEAELAIAEEEFGTELGQVPEAQRRSVLLNALVNMKLLAQAARDAGLHESEAYQERLEFLQMQALRNTYVEQEIVDTLTPEELQSSYETLVLGEFEPEEQVRARHILVETEAEAEEIIAELEGGAEFEELAKRSKDPSGQNGGDLGFFGRGQMVPPFEQAAFSMEPGTVSEQPVESQFGWHVIKVEEKRMSEAPALEDVEEELRSYVLRQKFQTTMEELRDRYEVEIVGEESAPEAPDTPAGEAVPEAQDAPAGEAPETPAGETQPD